jgi:hypothetical protein
MIKAFLKIKYFQFLFQLYVLLFNHIANYVSKLLNIIICILSKFNPYKNKFKVLFRNPDANFEKVCIFAYFNPKGILEKNVVDYLGEIKKYGYETIFISTSNISPENIEVLSKIVSLVCIRPNQCHDFGGYKIGLELLGSHKPKEVLLANSSVVCIPDKFEKLMKWVKDNPKEFMGFTDSCDTQRCYHYQSYFLVFKGQRAVEHLLTFFKKFKIIPNIKFFTLPYVISFGETSLSRYLTNRVQHDVYVARESAAIQVPTTSAHFFNLYDLALVKKKIISISSEWEDSIILDFQYKHSDLNLRLLEFINTKDINILSIVYDENSHSHARGHKLCNFLNPEPDFREYYAFKSLYESLIQYEHNPQVYYGALSWKFPQKTGGLQSNIFKNYMSLHINKCDVFFINPYPSKDHAFPSVFHQGELYHPGIMDMTNNLLRMAGYNFSLAEVESKRENMAYCNYWVGNKKFWDEYIAFTLPLYNFIKFSLNKSDLPKLYERADKFIEANYISFIFERMFTLFLDLHPHIKAKRILTFRQMHFLDLASEIRK